MYTQITKQWYMCVTWNGGRALMQLLHLSSIQAQQVLPEGSNNTCM